MKFFFSFFFLIPFVSWSQNETDTKVQLAFDMLLKYPNTRDLAMTSDGKECFFTVQTPLEEKSVIAFSQKKDDQWTQPEIVSFSGKYRDLEPFLSADGLRLYFASNRPLIATSDTVKDFDIWYVERKQLNANWSEPVNLGSPVNTANDEFYPSLSKNGNLYFTCTCSETKGKDDIYFSEWKNNLYTKPVSLSDSVNSAGYEFNAFVSPDESFLLFTGYNRKDGVGSGDLLISYKRNGSWSKAENLGKKVNSQSMDYCPFYDDTNSMLYFTSKRSNLGGMWNLEHKSLEEFLNTANRPENGLSRIYKVNIKLN